MTEKTSALESASHTEDDPSIAGLRAILAERERELLEVKGPCRFKDCSLHYAHYGPCNVKPPERTSTLTFTRPCTLCHGDIHVINGERQRHVCKLPGFI
jgi:hypothetical protein